MAETADVDDKVILKSVSRRLVRVSRVVAAALLLLRFFLPRRRHL